MLLGIACGPMFYQAPPTLGTYPERVSAKRWPHLFAEAAPLDPALPVAATLDESIARLPGEMAGMDEAARFAAIDRLLDENRRGPYASTRANLLHELRELAGNDDYFRDAKPYITWRIGRIGHAPKIPLSVRPWNVEEADFVKMRDADIAAVNRELDSMDQLTGQSPASMLPYWLVQRGHYLFQIRRHADAATLFSDIIERFPDHPRAEVACLMLARSKIEQSRELRRQDHAGEKHDEIFNLLSDAEDSLTEFVSAKPKGRFTPDAEGWLGAIAFDRGQFGNAVNHQLKRLDLQPTREITRTVLRECDFIFEKLIESRDAGSDGWVDPQELFDPSTVARHPLVARLFVQHCIDPAAHIGLPMWWDDSETGGRGTIEFLKRRIFKPKTFVRSALNGLGSELLKVNRDPDATTLTLLAWAATEDGEHEQALALLSRISPAGMNDEAMQARAIVLQRLGRDAEAVEAFNTLASAHPSSPLLNDIAYRRSVSHFRSGHADRAILEILPLAVSAADGEKVETIDLRPEYQVAQWLDTLIQFCPLEQLESACAGVAGNPLHHDLLRNAVRTRAFAAKRFDIAERHLAVEGEDVPARDEWRVTGLESKRRMDRNAWDAHAAPLAALYRQLEQGGPSSAGLHLSIARQWLDQRGILSMPSIALGYYAGSEEEKQELLRRRNALELGFDRETVHRELDHRDEASHALEHALEAAKSTDPLIAAPALELANQCLFRLAEFSLYQKSRALETDASKLSADLFAQLRERFPKSNEAKRAVRFTFTPAAGPWMPGDYNPSNSASAMIAALEGYDLFDTPDDTDALEKIGAIAARFNRIDPATPVSTVRKNLEAAKLDLQALRPLTLTERQDEVIRTIDLLDDLFAATQVPGVRGVDLSHYVANETEKLPPSFASLLDFRDRLKRIKDENGNETTAKNDTIEGWRAFLESYPDSSKAEAASFRLTRLIARQYRSKLTIEAFHFPDAPIPNGYKRIGVTRNDPLNEPEVVIAAIRDHDARFPAGRYRDDLNLLLAGALTDSGKYREPLVLIDSILGNPVQKDLHVLAALEFADIAQRLLEPSQRMAVARAMRGTPGAMARLRLMVEGDTFLSRLKPLMPWLEEG